MTYLICLVASIAVTTFSGLAFYEMRNSRREDYSLDYKSYYDYIYIYAWLLISAIASYLVTLNLGGTA